MNVEVTQDPGVLETDKVEVRTLKLDDLDAVVRIDEAGSGTKRRDFLNKRIRRSLEESSIHLSIAAEIDGIVAGFATVTFFQGEFGHSERSAVLDVIGVHPDYRGKKVAAALLRQLEMNLAALHVEVLRTEVDWDQPELISFFNRAKFQPAARLCLEKKL